MAVREELDTILDESEYPPNKKYSVNKSESDHQIIVKEPNAGKKFLSTFFQGDFKTVGTYLLQDILLPTIKDTFADICHSVIDILLTGESSHGRVRSKNKDRVSYNKVNITKSSSATYASPIVVLKDIIFENASDALEVLDNLCDIIDREGAVSVADYYEACGEKSDFTDNNRGWESLASARVTRVSGGYIIKLPRPIRL